MMFNNKKDLIWSSPISVRTVHHDMIIDMKETNISFILNIELPGIDKSKFDVIIDNNKLSISAEKNEIIEKINDKIHLSERRYGNLKRIVTIPENIDIENISAKYIDGILTIVLQKQPKSITAKSLKIE